MLATGGGTYLWVKDQETVSECLFVTHRSDVVNYLDCVRYPKDDSKCSIDPCELPIQKFIQPTNASIALMGFPGSGGHWVRHLVQEGTRIITTAQRCSVSHHYAGDHPGECLSEYHWKHSVLTHFTDLWHPNHYFPYKPTRYLIMVRNPFDSILSYYHTRVACGVEDDKFFYDLIPKANTLHCMNKVAPPEYFGEDTRWKDFVLEETKRWKDLYEIVGNLDENMLHFVFYEDLKQKQHDTVLGILEWIHGVLGMWVLDPNTSQKCAMRAPDTFGHRLHDANYRQVYTQEMIDASCEIFGRLWNEDIFGSKCNEYLVASHPSDFTL
ncbi:MAG: sulfotransferase domain-containing protein [Promethearchaeota archaeon]